MAKNKVVYGNTPLIDLTTDTATAENVLIGNQFMGSNGVVQTGTMQASGASVSGANISIAGKTYQPPSWATGTPEQIADFLDYYYSGRFSSLEGFWNEGDTRAIQLSDNTTVYYVIQFGSQNLVNSVKKKTKSAFSIVPKYITHSRAYSHYVSSRQTWSISSARTWANGTYYNSFPADFKALLKQYVSEWNTNDYFEIPSGNRGIMKNTSGTAQQYWLSSYPSNYAAQGYYVDASGTTQRADVDNSKGMYLIGAI